MYKCSVCKGDTKYDEFTDYKHMVCINCEEEHNEDCDNLDHVQTNTNVLVCIK